jgi:hypothetical protein
MDTILSVEKISSSLFEDDTVEWTKVADNITIPMGLKKHDDSLVNIIDKAVAEDDYFRIVVDSTGLAMRNITVEVVVKIDVI